MSFWFISLFCFFVSIILFPASPFYFSHATVQEHCSQPQNWSSHSSAIASRQDLTYLVRHQFGIKSPNFLVSSAIFLFVPSTWLPMQNFPQSLGLSWRTLRYQKEVSLLRFKVQEADRKFEALQSCVVKLDYMGRRFDTIDGKAADWGGSASTFKLGHWTWWVCWGESISGSLKFWRHIRGFWSEGSCRK